MRKIITLLLLTLSIGLSAQINWDWNSWNHEPASEPTELQYKEYTVKKGYHSYIPGTGTTFYRNKTLSKIEYSVVFDVSSEYDWKGDLDQLDWNKGGGAAYDWRRNDKDNIMWAWRYNVDSSRYELTVYRDWKYKNLTGLTDTKDKSDDVVMTALSGDVVNIDFIRTGKKEWLVFFENKTQESQNSGTVKVRVNPRWSRRIGPWFGGADNSPGDYGGVASKNMTMWIWYNAEN